MKKSIRECGAYSVILLLAAPFIPEWFNVEYFNNILHKRSLSSGSQIPRSELKNEEIEKFFNLLEGVCKPFQTRLSCV